mgnify:CR=1 FL=1
MASWKKIALETTAVSFSDLTLTSLSAQNSEATALMINGSNVVGTRELGTLAFSNTATTTAALTDGTGIADFTFDGSGAVSISTDDSAIVHDNLSGFVSNEHINHTLVNIATATGTSGLSGGGNIASTRNLVVDIAGTTLLDEAAATDDEVLIYDTSGTALKSVTVANLVASAGAVDSVQLTGDTGNTGADVGTVAHTITGLAESGISTSVSGDTLSIDLNVSSLTNTLAFDSAAEADLILVDDGANGTSKKMTLGALTDFIEVTIAVPNTGLINDSIQIGTTEIELGASSATLAGMTAIDFTNADHTIAASMGSGSTLTLGGASSTVLIAGDLQVTGNTETISSTELLVEDKTITLADGAHSAAAGDAAGIIVDTSATNTTRANFIWKNTGIGVAGWQFKDDGATVSTPDMGVAALTLGTANPTSTTMPVGSLFYNDGTSENEGLYLYTTT